MPIDYKKLYLKCFEEKKALKKEQFDNMEELAKQEGMCLVDIQIFDRLINYEKENEELKEKLESRNKEFYNALARNRGMKSQNEWKRNRVSELFDENKELKKKLLILEDHTGSIDTRILYEDEDWYKKTVAEEESEEN